MDDLTIRFPDCPPARVSPYGWPTHVARRKRAKHRARIRARRHRIATQHERTAR